MRNIIAAIDIGTTKIVAIAGAINADNGMDILGMEKTVSRGVKRGVIHNIEEATASIREVVDRLRENTGEEITSAYVGIAGQHIRSVKNRQYKYIESPQEEITKEDIEEIMSDNLRIPIEVGEQILHIIPQDYVVDKEAGIRNPIGMAGRRLDGNFNIIVGRSAAARNIYKCVESVGVSISDLILEPIASSKAVLTREEMESGVILVDIGGGTTDVTIYLDGILRHTAVIPFGGDSVTKDIKEACSVLLKQAEALKIKFGHAQVDPENDDKVVTIPSVGGWDPKEIGFNTLAHIIQCRMEEILDSVTYQADVTGLIDKIGAGIVFTGGGSLLNDIAKLASERTGLDIRIGYPDIYDVKLDDEKCQPIFATSVGLLIEGVERDKKKAKARKALEEQKQKSKSKTKVKTKKSTKTEKTGLKRLLSSFFDTDDVRM
ncbi:MAG: cell division protein FtsA [Marinifilaceae bacterium]|jgi:cell division protein FtsA|nr:cell division protein FtsA [Marinifilaceae bacterium]